MNPIKNARQRRCRETRALMSDYIDGQLLAPEKAAVAGHLGRCRNCSRMLENLTRTTEALRSLGEPPGDSGQLT